MLIYDLSNMSSLLGFELRQHILLLLAGFPSEVRSRGLLPVIIGNLQSVYALFYTFITIEERCLLFNRLIVLLRPGHEVRGIMAVRSCKTRCFLYFFEALSWLWYGFERLFFFSACLKDTGNVW